MAKQRIPEPPESTRKLIQQPPLFYRDGRALSEQERYPRPAVAAPTGAQPAQVAPFPPDTPKLAEAPRPAAPNSVADRNRHPVPRLIPQPPLFYRDGRALSEQERYPRPAVAAPTGALPAQVAPLPPDMPKVAQAPRPAAPNLVADRNHHPVPRLIQQPPLFYRNGRLLPEHERFNRPAPAPQPLPARPRPLRRNTSGDWLLKLVPLLLAIGYVAFMVMMSALTIATALAMALVFRLGRR